MNAIPSRYPVRLIFVFVTLLALILIGALGYHWLEGMSVIDALYMTIITISTVGFGEVRPLSPGGRLFTIALIISGGSIAAFSLTGTVEFILSGEWRNYFEARRRSRMLAKLSGHIIVCGFGRVGKRVADELTQEGVPFIVVDLSPEKVAHAREHGYNAIIGNAANDHILLQVGLASANGLVAVVNSDAENVFIVLTARSLKPDIHIIARANYEDSEPKLLRAGANRTIVPYNISGKRIVTMLMRPSVADFLDEISHVSGLELLIEQINIKPNSPLAGKTLAEANIRKIRGVSILACRGVDGQFDTHPGPQTIIAPNGVLLGLGTKEQLRDLIKYANDEEPRNS